ncbi:MAG: FAD-dependent oxidoreductase [Bacteroidetes bacterium B1(2017)]|nr:MAG: FAD-dependent oxidoreductase [Bacteroidetes bacterium B1(2017)]
MAYISRKQFLKFGVAALAVAASGKIWFQKKILAIQMQASNANIGHLLRNKKTSSELLAKHTITDSTETRVAIIGGGISGLSAARILKKNNIPFVLLELNNQPGGNAISGKNEVSAYPWGAHYLPIPNLYQPELINFLTETGVITETNELGLPVYNDYYLCSAPEERLFIHHYWQEGIIPETALKEQDHRDIKTFFELISHYKNAIGSDQKEAFCIPIENSSQDLEFLKLDKQTMADFLLQHELKSTYLLWYLNYCCKDDFGTPLNKTSAWAGIHYFASRKGIAANATAGDVLTWPEGNNFLVQGLTKPIKQNILENALVVDVNQKPNEIEILYLNHAKNTYHKIICKQAIIATPQYINKKIIRNYPLTHLNFDYFPWLVANITTLPLAQNKGTEMSWDNVLYTSESLGYVNACHQHLDSKIPKYVLTYYLPLCKLSAKEERKLAFEKTQEEWAEIVLKDLEKAHPDLRQQIEKIDLKVWGHAMISPQTGVIWNTEKKQFLNNSEPIYYAHSDLSGISIFEEAFYQGTKAAQQICKQQVL